ncbi:NAD(P)/FAD-dependent oxidoreductase [Paenibacillus mucilaginosus]|uniref:Monooxygenase FAD-binding protein n=1 Tax=Paenibacillus mucilaginosus (strain KNP414) TaxID=1036673 RepID=F8FC19_PAEMK|nr:FAD-dependent monooxygenase [Paenibacillus mucilaginosus]AEI43780.1 monooxygenase FAD-binding protein [Paenibacillus mucilaginosus KNP414]MCG7212699.1 FAD-dependent monooxygenase [Paenibacillus mucilaginosus]WDM25282.1 FAD-dependent monooxygenase [Paenibacillus mucilaginosus]
MSRVYDAAVIGAGIGGSAAAMALAGQGWDVLLLDGRRFPRHKVCGEFLSPESRSMLESLGFREAVAALSPAELTHARLYWGGGPPLEVALPGRAIGVSRQAMDPALHAEVRRAGAEVLTETAVTAVGREKEAYRVETKCGGATRVFHARAVIGAWGGGPSRLSEVRAADSPYVGVKAHFGGVAMEPAVELFVFPGGYLGMAPVEGGGVNVAALLHQEAFAAAGAEAGAGRGPGAAGLLLEAAGRHPQLREKLAAAAPLPGTEAAIVPNLRRRPQAWGSFAHVGDACVTIPPLCGDGMSMALRSALLCTRLADGFLRGSLTEEQWRRQYERGLHREFAGPLRWGHLLQSLFARQALAGPVMRLARSVPLLPERLLHATRLRDVRL